MKTTIDDRGVVSTNPELANQLVVTGTTTFQGSTSFQGVLNVSGNLTTTPTNVAIYVSPTGNDSNAGTAAAPVATIVKALSLLPVGRAPERRIHFASGAYEWPNDRYEIYLQQPLGVEEPVAFIGGLTVLFTGSVTAVNSLVSELTASALSMTPDAYAGKTLRMTSGVDSGSTYVIGSNGVSSFNLGGYPFWMGDPSPGDTFTVEQPNVTFNMNAPQYQGIDKSVGVFYGIKFLLGAGLPFYAQCSEIYMESCELDASANNFTSFLLYDSANVYCDLLANYFPTMTFAAPSGYPGIFIKGSGGGSSGMSVTTLSSFYGQATFRTAKITIVFNSSVKLFGSDIRTGYINVGQNSSLGMYSNTKIIGAPTDAVTITETSTLLGQDGLFISGSTGNGIVVTRNSYAALDHTTGRSSARGLVVSRNSSVDVVDPNTTTTISGSTGAVLVGGNSLPTTWAAIAGGGITAVTDFSASVPQFCRVQTG